MNVIKAEYRPKHAGHGTLTGRVSISIMDGCVIGAEEYEFMYKGKHNTLISLYQHVIDDRRGKTSIRYE